MLEQMQIANGIISVIASACIAGVVLNPRVREGLICKCGFILMVFGLMGNAAVVFIRPDDWLSAWNAGFILRLGIVIVCIGVAWRANRDNRKQGN